MDGVFEIVKKRWPEVVLVVGFQGIFFVLRNEILKMAQEVQGGQQISGSVGFVFGFGSVFFAILSYMLLLGFWATAWREGSEARKSPVELLSAGRHYFWRMLRFDVLLSIVLFGLAIVIFTVLDSVMGLEKGQDIPVWVGQVVAAGAVIILLKPMVLCPAIMIVRDRMVLESLGCLRDYELLKATRLLGWTVAAFALFSLASPVSLVLSGLGALSYVILGGYGVLTGVFLLVVGLEAMAFVGAGERQCLQENL